MLSVSIEHANVIARIRGSRVNTQTSTLMIGAAALLGLALSLHQATYDDGNEDVAWDGAWDVATRIDALGWSAEFRIPLAQLRFGKARSLTFGIMIDRDIYRYAERVSWPVLRQSKSGIVHSSPPSGLNDLEAPRRLEALPYVVTRSASEIPTILTGRDRT